MITDLLDALGDLDGVAITVRHALNPGAARLMETLGVTVHIDPTSAPCPRFVVMSRGEPDRLSNRICPECSRAGQA